MSTINLKPSSWNNNDTFGDHYDDHYDQEDNDDTDDHYDYDDNGDNAGIDNLDAWELEQ